MMREIALNILDVAQNSLSAQATEVKIIVKTDTKQNRLKIEIADNGKGMSEDFLKKVTDPFTTTRTTRKVGLGLPFFKDSALITGGKFDIKSKLNAGTTVTAEYVLDSIDRMPLGDIADTVIALIMAKDTVRIILNYSVDGQNFCFDTEQAREIMGDVPLSSYEVVTFLKEYINNGIKICNGGIVNL